MNTALDRFHPLIQSWFKDKYPEPTDIQTQAWPRIAEGEHLLITAPTGSGKTLTAFLWAINQFLTGTYESGKCTVLYVSPLKALNNDIQRNLHSPLAELKALAEQQGQPFPDIRVQTRSGDTDADDRRRMLRHPPEILITTPESLNLLLSSRGGQSILSEFKTVILDEIHGVVDNKRGVYLMSAIERLVPFSGEFQRIVLSATVTPLSAVADYVAGYEHLGNNEYQKRQVNILQSLQPKEYEVRVRYPEETANRPIEEKVWETLAGDFVSRIRQNTSTLLFVNARATCEKLTYMINDIAGETLAYAHHGSLSREIRADVEYKLKHGQLAAIVATSTLEMGIDIGHLDEVVLVQAPEGISAAIQRIGRAGHGVGEVSRCTLYPTDPLDFIESAVLSRAVIDKDLEPLKLIYCPLDVLAQIIISMTGTHEWDMGELFQELKRSSAFHQLTEKQFELVINMLAGRYDEKHIRELRPKVALDRDANTIVARKGALMSLYLSGGVIPDRGYFQIRMEGNNARIGELDEEFVWEANVGNVFAFGTGTWQVKKITHNDVIVAPAKPGKTPPPFWKAEGINRSFHYAERIGKFLEHADSAVKEDSFPNYLQEEHFLEPTVAEELTNLLKRQKAHTTAPLPHRHHLLVERTQSSPGKTAGQQVVLHTGWGSRVNRPLAMAMEAGWQRKWDEQPEIWVSDQCLVVQLTGDTTARELFSLVPAHDIENLLRERLEGSGFFGARFRENAGRALLLSKGRFNERKPLWMSRLQSQKLMASVMKYEDFPLLIETWRTCLQDEFDLDSLRLVLEEMDNGLIQITETETATPSPFAQTVAWGQINTYMYMDDEPKASRQSNLQQSLLEEIVFKPGLRPAIPAEIIEDFIARRQRSLPGYQPETTAELIEWVKERTAIPEAEWPFVSQGEDIELEKVFLKVSHEHGCYVPKESSPVDFTSDTVLANWLQYYGPVTTDFIAEQLEVSHETLEPLLQLLADERTLIHGQLVQGTDETYWCDAQNFEVLLRFVRQQARRYVEAKPLTQLTPFLYHWQTQYRHEDDALYETIDRLMFYPAPAAAWESDFFPSRMTDYRKDLADLEMQKGSVMWLGAGESKVMFSFKEDLDLLNRSGNTVELFSDPYSRYDFSALLERTGLTASELSQQLWAAVWSGDVTNDSMGALRKGIDHQFSVPDVAHGDSGRRGSRSSRRIGSRSSISRWTGAIPFTGNWYLPRWPEITEDLLELEELNKDRVRLLLERYGILFRELLTQELPDFQWRNLFRSLRLMELSGEVFSGYFFADIPGPQFVSQAALRQLQSMPINKVFWINAIDPISLCGAGLPSLKGMLPRRVASNYLVYDGTELVMTVARQGKDLSIVVEPDHPELPKYFSVLQHLLYRDFQPLQKITLETINGEPARQSPYLPALEQQFEVMRDYKNVYLQRSLL